MVENLELMIILFVPILAVLGWVLYNIFIQYRIDKKKEQASHEGFEKDCNPTTKKE